MKGEKGFKKKKKWGNFLLKEASVRETGTGGDQKKDEVQVAVRMILPG